jgi:tol-pal system protein YbgF
MERFLLAISLCASSLVLMTAPSLSPPGKGEKEAIEKLTSEVLFLQRQVRDMQESMTSSKGELTALVGQAIDHAARANQMISQIQGAMNDTQARVSGNIGALDTRLLAIEANLQTANDRLVKTLDQFAALNQQLAALQRQIPVVDPTDPVQAFSAAYGDYIKGNHQLAIEQFRLFVVKFPQSEQADDAQYMIGDAFYSQGNYAEALVEFDKVLSQYPDGNKVPAARLKKGLVYFQINQNEEGATEMRTVIKDFPDSPEAATARQILPERGLPVEDPKGPSRPRRRPN